MARETKLSIEVGLVKSSLGQFEFLMLILDLIGAAAAIDDPENSSFCHLLVGLEVKVIKIHH